MSDIKTVNMNEYVLGFMREIYEIKGKDLEFKELSLLENESVNETMIYMCIYFEFYCIYSNHFYCDPAKLFNIFVKSFEMCDEQVGICGELHNYRLSNFSVFFTLISEYLEKYIPQDKLIEVGNNSLKELYNEIASYLLSSSIFLLKNNYVKKLDNDNDLNAKISAHCKSLLDNIIKKYIKYEEKYFVPSSIDLVKWPTDG